MAYPNGQEYLNETEVDVIGGEPLANSGFEDENPESDFREGAEE
jgi:hypothetical protein